MSYVIPSDYLKIIQDANLQQIISYNPGVQNGAELAAQAEAISYLRQKYDVNVEFTNTSIWGRTLPYSAGNRVYLNAATYFTTNTYYAYDLTLFAGKVYQCLEDDVTGTFDVSKWELLGIQYDIFYALNPFPVFNLEKLYNRGDMIFWQGNIYRCLIQTPIISHEDGIQYYQQSNIPYANVFPNDIVNGIKYWEFIENYIIDAGTDILNESIWSFSDNRDQQMVMYFTDITLYHLHARIAPRNIPELRITRYQAAIEWLKMAAKGEITPNLPVLQPKQGSRIRFGGQVRNINSY